MKRRMIAGLLSLVVAGSLLTGCGASGGGSNAGENGELKVYNWGEYIDEDVIKEFEEQTGINVTYDVFETNEEMYPIIEAGAVKYDVVCPSDYMIEKMIENDLLAELNFDNIPNAKNIGATYMEKSKSFDPENKYSVPYTWGTVGILYNTSMVDEVPDSWDILWDEKYSGEILMQNSVRDAFMVSLKSLGYSLNSMDEDELGEAKDKLVEQKPLVQAYVIDQVRDKMISGEAALGVIYSGELLYTQSENEDLEYVIPKEGSNVWIDSWVIPANAENKENAEKWIDFLCDGEIAKKNFEYITYPTPNTEALKLIDEETTSNLSVFPTEDMLENCEVFKYLGNEGDEIYNNLWKEVKSAD